MTAPNPRAGWEKVGDQFYRKIQLYESVFDSDLELENYLVAGAPYGGAIGRHGQRRDDAELIRFQHYIEMRVRSLGIEVARRRSQVSTSIHAPASSSAASIGRKVRSKVLGGRMMSDYWS